MMALTSLPCVPQSLLCHVTTGLFIMMIFPICPNAAGKTFLYMQAISSRTVSTQHGKVRGGLIQFPSESGRSHLKDVDVYFGMRYAGLNGGNMRFMPPTSPKESWKDLKQFVEQHGVCPQPRQPPGKDGRLEELRNLTSFVQNQTENCLSLNLYVPMKRK